MSLKSRISHKKEDNSMDTQEDYNDLGKRIKLCLSEIYDVEKMTDSLNKTKTVEVYKSSSQMTHYALTEDVSILV